MKVEIKQGGSLTRMEGKLSAIKVQKSDIESSKKIALWIESTNLGKSNGLPDDSVTYLSLDETVELIRALQLAVAETAGLYIPNS